MPGRRTVKHLRNLRYELDAMNEQLKIQMIELASLNNRLLLSDSQLNGLEEENKDRSRPDIRPQVLVASCLQDDESGTQFTSATLTRAVEEAAQRRAEFQKFKWRTQDWLEEVRKTMQEYCFRQPASSADISQRRRTKPTGATPPSSFSSSPQ